MTPDAAAEQIRKLVETRTGSSWPKDLEGTVRGLLLQFLVSTHRLAAVRIRELFDQHDGELVMSQQQMGDMLGLHRETVTRNLRRMGVSGERVNGSLKRRWRLES